MIRKTMMLLSLIICLSLVISGCTVAETTKPTSPTTVPANTTTGSNTLDAVNLMAGISSNAWSKDPVQPDPNRINAINRFSAGLLLESLANEGNLLVSPTSVFLALAMTLNGADGDTRSAMLETLAGKGLSAEEINAISHDLMALLSRNSEKTSLSIANSIWFDQHFKADPVFLQTNADHFKAGAFKLDFADPKAKDAINGWVKNETRGLIEKLIERIDPQTVMFLINTVYFVSDWQVPFDKNQTRAMDFHTSAGTVTTDFMHRVGMMDTIKGNGVTGVILPYEDPQFAYFALLPDGDVSPRDWLAKQDETTLFRDLADWIRLKSNLTVDLLLPKYKASYEDSLLEELKALGMGIALNGATADFTKLSEDRIKGLFITEVKHKTFIRVDEKGTEAAAATAVVIGKTAIAEADLTLAFDRPFVYGIMDMKTRMPIFVGVLEDPAA